jgi:hypothetical protein
VNLRDARASDWSMMLHAMKPLRSLVALAVLVAQPALGQQRDPQQVIRVAMTPEQLAQFAEHTKNHLGLFDTSNPAFDLVAFVSAGSKRDPLPAILTPEREPAKDATFPPRTDLVLEVVIDGEAVAYPMSLLTYHGVINDTIAGTPIAVWFDPISNGLAVFRRDLRPTRAGVAQGDPREFRLAGLLVRGSAALYDSQSKSLFSPLDGFGVTGPYSGAPLEYLPFRMTTMGDFVDVRPMGEVVKRPKGSTFDYTINPFAGYQGDANFVYMQVTDDLRLSPKVTGVGVTVGDDAYFIPLAVMVDEERSVMTMNGPFVAELTPDRTLRIKESPSGATIAQAYFANWVAAHPRTKIVMKVEVSDLPPESLRGSRP